MKDESLKHPFFIINGEYYVHVPADRPSRREYAIMRWDLIENILEYGPVCGNFTDDAYSKIRHVPCSKLCQYEKIYCTGEQMLKTLIKAEPNKSMLLFHPSEAVRQIVKDKYFKE